MDDDLERFLRPHDQGLDLVAEASGRLRNQLFFAQFDGARNLLEKALVALAGGDEARLDKLVGRVAAMGYDDREEGFVGVRAAVQLLHDAVHDALMECDEDDASWLDAALAALDRVTGPGRAQLASVVNGFVLQEGLYHLPQPERRRIHREVGDAPLEVEPVSGPQASIEERVAVVRSRVEATAAYHQALSGGATTA